MQTNPANIEAMTDVQSEEPLLRVDELRLHFDTRTGIVPALEGISFAVRQGESLGIVGETGSGKSMTARAIMGLVPGNGRIVGGSIRLNGEELLTLPSKAWRGVRGRKVSMVFQEAKRALNPVCTVGDQIIEAAVQALDLPRAAAKALAIQTLKKVGLADPERIMHNYSFEMSGGMAQRAMIAIAIIGGAKLIIADEPTSALDVSIQAQILGLLRDLRRDLGSALILITHDLGVAAENCDRIAVMYLGQIVEVAPSRMLFENPSHPYTCALLAALPSPAGRGRPIGRTVRNIPPPRGFRYAERRNADGSTVTELAEMVEIESGHFVACQKADVALAGPVS
jgi:oligopeptide/dipeptide ABC transporter ATP-binding protein